MARKKKPSAAPERSWRERLEDLVGDLGSQVPEGALEGELWDACEMDAEMQHEELCKGKLLEQLEFLFSRGFSVERLRELLEAAARDGKL